MISSSDLRTGMTFQHNEDIFVCMEISHNKTARAAANIKVKMRNLRSGAITTNTFGSNDKFQKAMISKVQMQYLYTHGENAIFMNNKTYDQVEIPKVQIAWELNFLKEGNSCDIRTFQGDEILGIELKPKVNLKVVEAEPSIKGDTATNVQIKVKLDTGFELYTPGFIKKGEVIEISTADGKYSGRGN